MADRGAVALVLSRGSATHEFVTTFVIRHYAGSQEGAVFQRNQWDKLIESAGGELTMADTKPGDAAGEGVRKFFEATENEDE